MFRFPNKILNKNGVYRDSLNLSDGRDNIGPNGCGRPKEETVFDSKRDKDRFRVVGEMTRVSGLRRTEE